MPRLRPGGSVLALGFVALIVLPGCAAWLAGSGGTKAGGEPVPVTLRLGTVESGQLPYRFFVEEFAREVEERSAGGIRIDVQWQANPWGTQSEALLGEQVGAGEIDLALLPDRSFDRFGPSALDALHTPFLVDSMALADEIAAGEIGRAMLADLPIPRTVGLALAPEDLRHPAGYLRAVSTAADFEGLRIRTPQVDAEAAMLRALGADPRSPQDYRAALVDGSLDAVETAYPFSADLPTGMIYTANLTFFAKVNVLVASAAALGRLPVGGEATLRAAAEAARDLAAALRPTEESELAGICVSGHDAVLANADELATLAASVAPLIAELRSDSRVAASIDAIESLKASLPPAQAPVPEVCGPPTGDAARPTSP